jgi:hypothetical protein
MRTIGTILPDFIRQVGGRLRKLGREDIADQVPVLELDDWTCDRKVKAIYIYLSGQKDLNVVEENVIGVKHDECLELSDIGGTVVVDIDNFSRPLGIEVIGRGDVEQQLRRVCLPSQY